MNSFNDLNAFGNITTAHVVETYDSELEISEDKETGEKNVKVVYEVNRPLGQPDANKAKGKAGVEESKRIWVKVNRM